MRKGARLRPWTTADDRFLLESAGRMPKREICKALRRSSKSVEMRAYQLRKRGHAVELRFCRSDEGICPACGNASTLLGREGICEPCRRRAQLAEIESRTAVLLARLTPEQRAVYERTEASTESRRAPYPPPPAIPVCASSYRRQKMRRDWRMECERVEAANLRREVKAAQKRKERIEKKVKTNGGLPPKAKRHTR